ncbi:hypothetical protein [Pseudobacteriovorax antillogorgiicola]|uniref:Uncharacterized protein n=1 Tax=Pseudobacteriovorax antillogorgiicola TaxID=1513793 RepID=A0A1Y6CRM4_9BACT|nr:hypothetical protein [Pseudobacteriovorax antillogorgiicola]TCS44276.1 hypothetical protein EDD56_13476 [Pseudobacteriovorax antillogorgiicola]SMF84369.1 hypothetical protein SAMN06296036_1542 [Pseudobacteriovorax antillogorgiicola]
MRRLIVLIFAIAINANAREVCNSVPIGLEQPDRLACNQPAPKPKPKKVYHLVNEFLDSVNNVMFCLSASDSLTDTSNQSCIVVKNKKFSLRHSGPNNWFDYMNMNFHGKLESKISSESYDFNFKTVENLPALKIVSIQRFNSLLEDYSDEPDWYLEELQKCEGRYNSCKAKAKFIVDWMSWWGYLVSDNLYTRCEKDKPDCIKIAKTKRKISEKMIYQGMRRVSGGGSGSGGSNPPGNGGGGGISAPIAGGSGNTCYGWNRVCIGNNECTRRWQEQKCD